MPSLHSFVLHLLLLWCFFFLSEHFLVQINLPLVQCHSLKFCQCLFPEHALFSSLDLSLFRVFSSILVSLLSLLSQTPIWYHFKCIFLPWWLLPACSLRNTALISIKLPPAGLSSFPSTSLPYLSFLHFHPLTSFLHPSHSFIS